MLCPAHARTSHQQTVPQRARLMLADLVKERTNSGTQSRSAFLQLRFSQPSRGQGEYVVCFKGEYVCGDK